MFETTKLKELFDSGMSFFEIAKIFDSEEYVVNAFCKSQGWTRKRKYGPSKKVKELCEFCGNEKPHGHLYFCSNKCQEASKEAKKKEIITRWLNGENIPGTKKFQLTPSIIRRHMMIEQKESCSKCGWNKKNPKTGKCPLELNHINGNALDNRKINLELICPNCHSLTENYRALNRESKRPYKMVQQMKVGVTDES